MLHCQDENSGRYELKNVKKKMDVDRLESSDGSYKQSGGALSSSQSANIVSLPTSLYNAFLAGLSLNGSGCI